MSPEWEHFKGFCQYFEMRCASLGGRPSCITVSSPARRRLPCYLSQWLGVAMPVWLLVRYRVFAGGEVAQIDRNRMARWRRRLHHFYHL